MNKSEFNLILTESILTSGDFSNYEWKGKESCLISYEDGGFKMLEVVLTRSYNLELKKHGYDVKIYYSRRFDILHEWFEKFSFKTKRDTKNTYSIAFSGRDLGQSNSFFFDRESLDIKDQIEKMLLLVSKNAINFFDSFKNLEKVYEYSVLPILMDTEYKLQLTGAEWIFEALLMVNIFNSEQFDDLNERLFAHAKGMYKNAEPNIVEYFNRYDEIVIDLKQVQLNK